MFFGRFPTEQLKCTIASYIRSINSLGDVLGLFRWRFIAIPSLSENVQRRVRSRTATGCVRAIGCFQVVSAASEAQNAPMFDGDTFRHHITGELSLSIADT